MPSQLSFTDASQRIDMVLRIGLGAKPRGDFADGTPLNKAQRYADGVLSILGAFSNAVRQIQGDQALTPIGKGQRFKAAGTEALGKVEALTGQDNMLAAIKRKLDSAEQTIANAIQFPDADNPANAIREREVRDYLYSLSDADRFGVWRKIVEGRDVLGISACVNAPKFRPIFNDPRIVQDGVSDLALATVPVAAQERQACLQAIAAIDMMRTDARTMIAGVANIELPRVDPITDNIQAVIVNRPLPLFGQPVGAGT